MPDHDDVDHIDDDDGGSGDYSAALDFVHHDKFHQQHDHFVAGHHDHRCTVDVCTTKQHVHVFTDEQLAHHNGYTRLSAVLHHLSQHEPTNDTRHYHECSPDEPVDVDHFGTSYIECADDDTCGTRHHLAITDYRPTADDADPASVQPTVEPDQPAESWSGRGPGA